MTEAQQELDLTKLIIGKTIRDMYETSDFVELPDGSKFQHGFLVIELTNGVFIRFPLGENVAIGLLDPDAKVDEKPVVAN
jgi:hypothetical protein